MQYKMAYYKIIFSIILFQLCVQVQSQEPILVPYPLSDSDDLEIEIIPGEPTFMDTIPSEKLEGEIGGKKIQKEKKQDLNKFFNKEEGVLPLKFRVKYSNYGESFISSENANEHKSINHYGGHVEWDGRIDLKFSRYMSQYPLRVYKNNSIDHILMDSTCHKSGISYNLTNLLESPVWIGYRYLSYSAPEVSSSNKEKSVTDGYSMLHKEHLSKYSLGGHVFQIKWLPFKARYSWMKAPSGVGPQDAEGMSNISFALKYGDDKDSFWFLKRSVNWQMQRINFSDKNLDSNILYAKGSLGIRPIKYLEIAGSLYCSFWHPYLESPDKVMSNSMLAIYKKNQVSFGKIPIVFLPAFSIRLKF